jgi:rRNA processing protein Krr1/Pno1
MTKKEYNPIVGGDILSFLNEPAAGTAAAAAAKPAPIQKPTAKGLNLKSDEMFPTLGGGDNAQHTDVIHPKVVWASKPAMPMTSSSNISQTFELPAEQQKPLKNGFGNGHGKQQPRSVSQICAGIAAKTHTAIDASTSSKTRAITFIIRGKQADVSEAKKLLWAELAQPMTMPVEVAEEHLGQIIGASGRTLQSIMAETGTRINVSKKGEEYPGYVLVTGDAEGVKQARAKIRAIVEEKEKRLVQTLTLKAHLLPFVYGVSSSRVSEQPAVLSEHFRIKVSHEVDREKDEAIITMSGDRDDVMLALNHLSSSYEEARKSIRSVSTAVPKAIHRFVIGPKGSTLHEMEAETNCIIHVPLADSPSDQVTVFGSEATLFRGLSMVLEKAGSLDNKTLPLSADVRQLVMDRFRGKLNEIESSFDVSIVQANDGLSVCGQKVKVPKAFTEVETLVKPLVSMPLIFHSHSLL